MTPVFELIKRVKEVHFSIFTSCKLSKKFNQILFNEIVSFENVLLLDIEFLKDDLIETNYDLVLLYQNIELNYHEYPKEYSFLWFSEEIFSSNKSYLDYFYPNGTDGEFNLLLMDIGTKFGVSKEVIGMLIQKSIYLRPFEYYVMLLKELAKSKNLLVAYQSFANQNNISSELISSREFIGVISNKT